MRYVDDPERKRISEQALWATTLPEIMTARRELDQWVDDHPDDLGILDAYEMLANMQEIAEEQEMERRRLAEAGRAA